MTKKDAAPAPTAKPSAPIGPWADLDAAGDGLSVDDFLTTVVSRAANALRRTITTRYADGIGLSISEWRMLSVLAHARHLTFPELVVAAVADKAQVSRALRSMQERGLVEVEKTGSNPRWQQVDCRVTPAGMALYRKVMPAARRAQAEMIRKLPPGDRAALYRSLKLLHDLCQGGAPDDVLE
jgi:DNA-binding MarR family transcriptional regulator